MRPLIVLSILLPAAASAQERSPEDRLRDALRQAVTEMRAAQDNAATLQAQLAAAQQQQAALQQQLDAARAAPPPPATPTVAPEALRQAQGEAQAARAQLGTTQAALDKWQSSYRQAAEIARQKDTEAHTAEAALKGRTAALDTARAENRKLISVAHDILHLYEDQSFRSLLLRSYEPVLGLWRVRLENTVQDYDDRIAAQQDVPKP